MPAWITSELRELVWVPTAAAASSTTTSRPARASARATASPITPAPITTASKLRSSAMEEGFMRIQMVPSAVIERSVYLGSDVGPFLKVGACKTTTKEEEEQTPKSRSGDRHVHPRLLQMFQPHLPRSVGRG